MSGLESELLWFAVLNGTWQTEQKPGPRTEASGGFLGKIKRVCKDMGSRARSLLHFAGAPGRVTGSTNRPLW